MKKLLAGLLAVALALSLLACSSGYGGDSPTYTVTYVDGVEGLEITVPSDTNEYHEGDSVTVKFTGVGSRTGYTFTGWSDGTTSYTSSGTTTFTMGSANVTLTAQWRNIIKSRPDAVGDIVLNDGKAIAYADFSAMTEAQKASAIALIFYKGTGLNNGTDTTTSRVLGVGLKQNKTGLAWCLNTANAYNRQLDQIQYVYSEGSQSFTTIGDKNGSGTFGKISAFLSNLTDGTTDDTTTAGNYPAFEFAKQYKTVEGSRVSGTSFEEGWYLPSYAELTEIFTNGKGVNKVFDIDAALQALGGDKFEENPYLSSSTLTWIGNYGTDTGKSMVLFGDDWYGAPKDYTTLYDIGSGSNKPLCVCCIREF